MTDDETRLRFEVERAYRHLRLLWAALGVLAVLWIVKLLVLGQGYLDFVVIIGLVVGTLSSLRTRVLLRQANDLLNGR